MWREHLGGMAEVWLRKGEADRPMHSLIGQHVIKVIFSMVTIRK